MDAAAAEARRAYKRAWREKNREHIRDYNRQGRTKNRDHIREYDRAYWASKAAVEKDGDSIG